MEALFEGDGEKKSFVLDKNFEIVVDLIFGLPYETEETYEENDTHKIWSNIEEELTNFICKYCIHINVSAKDNFSRIYDEYKNRNLDEYLRYLFGDTEDFVL